MLLALVATALAAPPPALACWDGTPASRTVAVRQTPTTIAVSVGGVSSVRAVSLGAVPTPALQSTPATAGTLHLLLPADACQIAGEPGEWTGLVCENTSGAAVLEHTVESLSGPISLAEALPVSTLEVSWRAREGGGHLRARLLGPLGQAHALELSLPHCNPNGAGGTAGASWAPPALPDRILAAAP